MKSWILNNLFSGNILVSKRCRISWFDDNNFSVQYNSIIDKTKFLNSDASISQRIWHIINDKYENIICNMCNKHVNFRHYSYGYPETCSNRCAQLNPKTINKIKSTNLKKYGTEYGLQNNSIKLKSKNTVINKYGVSNISHVSDIQKKKKITCLKNNGVEHPMQSKLIQDKSVKTLNEKYGINNIQQLDNIKIKSKRTKCDIYYDNFLMSSKVKSIVNPLFSKEEFFGVGYYDIKYKFKCTKCNSIFEDTLYKDIPRCLNCYPINSGMSKAQIEIFNFINENISDKVILNDTEVLNGKELDIYIPSKKIAIEFDGLYWHSQISGNKDKNYHLDKTKQCNSENIQLLHIFENEWFDKKDIVKSIIKSKLHIIDNKIYARKCEIKYVNFNEASEFYKNNHIQGSCQFKKTVGLYYNNNLVCAVSFGKNRFKNENSTELIRFCNKLNCSVIGGLSKLINFFIKNNKIKKIVSFADKRYSNGDIYIKNGFKLVDNTIQSYYYVKYGKLFNRINFQKHKLKDKLKIFDNKLTEWQNMLLNGYDRIWDCGNYKFEILTGE